jgi:hypothetical protein
MMGPTKRNLRPLNRSAILIDDKPEENSRVFLRIMPSRVREDASEYKNAN